MKKQKIVAVSGVKNSGKTTLLEKLIPELNRRGMKCAVIKHDGHSFEPDREGTDTWRMLTAGAAGAAVFDGEKYQLVKYAEISEPGLIDLFPEADLILLEGFKHSPWPKIEVVRKANSDSLNCDPATLLALMTDTTLRPAGVPTFGLEDVKALAERICDYIEE